tara:strand:- start:235 stop:453 length:219 start_codon:yes stop_codon:yes gene_type:complete
MIVQAMQTETSARIFGPDWVVDVVPSLGYTGCWYARTKRGDDERFESMTCGNRELAAEQAVKYVLENIWENL